jgi:hypothetical protein
MFVSLWASSIFELSEKDCEQVFKKLFKLIIVLSIFSLKYNICLKL